MIGCAVLSESFSLYNFSTLSLTNSRTLLLTFPAYHPFCCNLSTAPQIFHPVADFIVAILQYWLFPSKNSGSPPASPSFQRLPLAAQSLHPYSVKLFSWVGSRVPGERGERCHASEESCVWLHIQIGLALAILETIFQTQTCRHLNINVLAL